MHPRLMAMGMLWREGQAGLWREVTTVQQAAARLRADVVRLAEPRGLTKSLATAADRITRLDLADYRPRHGVTPTHFPQIAALTQPRWLDATDWAGLVALSIAARPNLIVRMVCAARYEVFDYLEARIPYLWEGNGGEARAPIDVLDRPVP